MKEKKIVFLSAFLHSGLDWVHSLLDSHPQLLITPAISFYRCWIKFNFKNYENGEKIYDQFFDYINKNIGLNCKNEQKKFLNNQGELDLFFSRFRELLKDDLISRKKAFLYIHEAYAFAKKIDRESIELIIAHEHIPFYKKFFKHDFPHSSIILVLRDPRAALAGIWYRRKKIFGYLPDYTFNMTLDSWFYAVNFLKDKFYTLHDNLYILKNEHLHNDLKGEMIKLTKWLKIDFNKSLLSETFPSGKAVFVDSAYLMNDRPNNQKLLNQNIPKDYFKIENVTRRWKDALSKSQIIMIENILSIIFKRFGYRTIYNKNILNKIFSLIIFFVPQKNLLNYWHSKYPNVDAFDRVYKRLNVQGNYSLSKIWLFLPNFIKFILLIINSIISRIKIYYSSKDRTPNYDKFIEEI
jgi:hypothetical protein